jgi:hypothetical protein
MPENTFCIATADSENAQNQTDASEVRSYVATLNSFFRNRTTNINKDKLKNIFHAFFCGQPDQKNDQS